MAGAPAGPRPGWSRRAQYSLFFAFIGALAAILIGVAMLALSIVAPSRYAAVRGAALDATLPMRSALSEVTSTVGGLVTGAGDYWNAANQNSDLRAERDRLRRELLAAKGQLLELDELKRAMTIRSSDRQALASGRIVGSSFDSPRRFAILSAGSSDGVAVGMPVRGADGLIGRIIDAGRFSSRILLVSDRSSIVPARLLRGGQPVIATGRGDGTLDVRPLEVGRNPFKRGDVIVTSGTGGLYPPLIPIGRVVRLDDDGAILRPLADPGEANFAFVEAPFEPAALADATSAAPGAPPTAEVR